MRIGLTALTGASIIVSMLALPGTASAEGAMKQVATAAQHAGYAAGAGDINGVHAHLHHTVNCLVGPDGEGFDANEANPCGDMGGAIPNAGSDEMKMKLQKIADEAMAGIEAQDLSEAQMHAKEVAGMLEKESM